jgi:tRNA nucleotidyltransferase (CCA-adding enzyme)
MAIHIPKNAKIPTQEQVTRAMKMVNYDDGPNVTTYKQNVARILASQGFQVYNAGLLQDDKKDYFVVLDRSMLTVADQDWMIGL